MPSPSKSKGNSFERLVADFLSNLYGETFIRVPGSGAYVGGKNVHRKQFLHEGQIRNFKGDIVPGPSFPRFNAECKSYKDFPFHQLFTGNVKILETWIGQCCEVADPGDFNILFLKFNRKGTYVAVQLPCSGNPSQTFNLSKHFIYDSNLNGSWAVMDLDTFFKSNAATVKALCQSAS